MTTHQTAKSEGVLPTIHPRIDLKVPMLSEEEIADARAAAPKTKTKDSPALYLNQVEGLHGPWAPANQSLKHFSNLIN